MRAVCERMHCPQCWQAKSGSLIRFSVLKRKGMPVGGGGGGLAFLGNRADMDCIIEQ